MTRFPRSLTRAAFLAATILSTASLTFGAAGVSMTMEVDASEITRKLLHTRIELDAKPGELVMWYPEWIPGIHAPRGPVENVAGLRVKSAQGDVLEWERDPHERYRFVITVPKGVSRLVIDLDYICSQPSTNSNGVDSYGNSLIGVINWNTCLLYPEGVDVGSVSVDLSVKFPNDWKWASSLRESSSDGDTVKFETLSLQDLVDSPMILGRHLRSIPLQVTGIPPFTLDVVSESEHALQVPEDVIVHYGNIASEAGRLFGGGHFESYRWLVYCSDDFPRTGLEHLRSSLNGVGERALQNEDEMLGWVGALLPHELAHSWCGKYRRPAGMFTPDFHTSKDTSGLWVYEGLTMHLGDMLPVRGGLWTLDHYKERLAGLISRYMHQMGRQWRPLEDTARDSYHLRGGSRNWENMRRGQDYYVEGIFIWLEVDALIREKSNGKNSLDDFCRSFLGGDYPDEEIRPFDLDEIIEELGKLANYDWAKFFEDRVEKTQERMPLDFVQLLGYRLEYSSEPSADQKRSEKNGKFASARDSIGIEVGEDGNISSTVVPGMPGDLAGLGPGMKIVGVNGRKFSLDRFRDGVADSVVRGNIEFLVLDGDQFVTYTVNYADGPKYLKLVRDPSRPDLMEKIYAPLGELVPAGKDAPKND